ncbi:MAG: hypothetical protein ABH843_06040 [Candidatus Omnitrophota bacterium]
MNMYIKSLSIILAVVYSTTSPSVYPHEMTSALRPLSTAKSAAKLTEAIGVEKSSSSGEVTIKSATWALYQKLKKLDFRNQKAWYNLINATETVDEAGFLAAVFEKFIKNAAESWRSDLKTRIGGAQSLAKARKVKLEAAIAIVKVVATNEGFEIEKEEPNLADVDGPELLAVDSFDDILLGIGIPLDKIFRKVENSAGDTLIIFKEDKGYHLYVIENRKTKKASGILVASDMKNRFFVFRTLDKGLFIYRFEDGKVIQLLGPEMEIVDKSMTEDRTLFAICHRNNLGVYLVSVYKFDSKVIEEPIYKFTDIGEPDEIVFNNDNSSLLLQYYKEVKTRMFKMDTGKEFPTPPADTMLSTSSKKDSDGSETTETVSADGPDTGVGIKKQDLGVDEAWLDSFVSAVKGAPFNERILKALLQEMSDPNQIMNVIDWVRQEHGDEIVSAAGQFLFQVRVDAHSKVTGEEGVDFAPGRARLAISQLNVNSDLRQFRKAIDLAKAVKPQNRQFFVDIKSALGKSMKIADKTELMDELTTILSKLPEEAKAQPGKEPVGIGLSEEKPKTTKSKSEPDIGKSLVLPTISDEIEIALDGSDADILVDGALDIDDDSDVHEEIAPEKLLENAKLEIFSESTAGGVDSVMKKHLKNSAVQKSDELQASIKKIADERKLELEKISNLYKILDKAIEKAAGLTIGAEEDINGWLVRAQEVYDKKAGSEQELFEAAGIAFDMAKASVKNSLYSRASALINRRRAFFKNWKQVVLNTKKISSEAVSFAKLDHLKKEMKGKYKRHKACLSILLIAIDEGRERLSKKQNTIVRDKKLGDVADIVYLEYHKLDKAFLEFRNAMEILNDKSKEHGYKNWIDAVSDSIDFEHAYSKEYGQFMKSGPGVYKEKGKRKKRLMPLKEHLMNVVNKRDILLKRLRAYREALKVIYGNYTPGEFMIAEGDDKSFDIFIFRTISEGMDKDILDRYRKAFKGSALVKYVIDADKHLQHLYKKLKKFREKKFELLTFDAAKKLLTVDKYPNVIEFINAHKIEPAPVVSTGVVADLKAISLINAAA